MKLKLLRFTFIFFSFFTASAALAQPTRPSDGKTEAKFPDAGAFANSNISYKIINAANSTFGYDILADNHLLIHQPTIPGVPGNNGFKTRAYAEKVAQLVIKKIRNGEMPPTVTDEDMKKLNITK